MPMGMEETPGAKHTRSVRNQNGCTLKDKGAPERQMVAPERQVHTFSPRNM